MFERLRQSLASQFVDDPDQGRITREIRVVLISAVGFIGVFGIFLSLASQNPRVSMLILGYIFLFVLLCFWLLYRGKPKAAGILFSIGLWSGLSYTAVISGGLVSPALTTMLLALASIGYIQGGFAGFLFAGLALISVLGLYFAEVGDRLPTPIFLDSPPHLLLFQLMNLTLAVVSIYFIILRIKTSVFTIRNHEKDLEKRNQELQEIRETLEQRVVERTAEITRQKKYFEALFHNSPLAIVTLDLSHRITSCNQAFENLFGYSLAEMLGRDLDDFVADRSMRKKARVFTEMALRGENVYATTRRRRKDGALIDVEIFGVPVKMDDQQVGILGLYHDITERRRTQESLEESEARFRNFFERASIGLFIANLRGEFIQVNRALAEMLDYPIEELLSSTIDNVTYPKDLKIVHQEMRRLLEGEIEFFQVEKRLVHKMKRFIWVLLNSSLVTDRDGTPLYVIGQVQDITSRKETEKRLEYLATHDSLTGLPNRALFFDRLDHAINLARRRLTRVAVLFLDLNSFKLVNDNFGHDTGDEVLQSLGKRMVACLRGSDTVARVGGDEFAFIIENVPDRESVIPVVEKINAAILEPLAVDGETVRLMPSVGVALFPDDGDDIRTLMIAADKAMYRARESEKDRRGFKPGQNIEVGKT